ncbi:MAG TPA: hypothetical protein VN519_16825 [Bryobacteraceae bacterium]|nr:hypothetical protein [Bryobacteraceae bacterium]
MRMATAHDQRIGMMLRYRRAYNRQQEPRLDFRVDLRAGFPLDFFDDGARVLLKNRQDCRDATFHPSHVILCRNRNCMNDVKQKKL